MKNQENAATGQFYWGITLDSGHTVLANADDVEINTNGDLLLLIYVDKINQKKRIQLAYAAGTWLRVWAASVHDGQPIAVQHVMSDDDEDGEDE